MARVRTKIRAVARVGGVTRIRARKIARLVSAQWQWLGLVSVQWLGLGLGLVSVQWPG